MYLLEVKKKKIIDSFQNRLKHAMEINNMKQVYLVEICGGMGKS